MCFLSRAAGLFLLCVTLSGTTVAAESSIRPNFLLLLTDDQRADTIASWGNPHIETPNIDRLTEEGFSFRSAYNLGSDVGAVCAPSRAMLNSGRSYFGVDTSLSGVRTLPEILKEAGYVTFSTGKWHNGESSWLRSFQRGQNVFFGGMSDHNRVPVVDLDSNGQLTRKRTEAGFSSELFADAAIQFLDEYEGDAPFYAYVAFTAPHDPRQPPPQIAEQYYRNLPSLPENFMGQHPFNLGSILTIRDEVLAAWPRDEGTIRQQLAEYYGMITHLDGQIGRILQQLEESGHAENTIVIFTSDHGLALGSHGLLGKQNLYEHSQKSPLIFSGPGLPVGASETLSYLLDLYPTVLSLARVQLRDGIDGHDLSPVWKGTRFAARDSLFLAYGDEMRAVRDHRYKLIRYPQINHTQLFDLEEDPFELNDLSSSSTHTERVETLMALLSHWQQKLGDSQELTVASPRSKKVDLTGKKRTPDRWQPQWIIEKYFGEVNAPLR